MPGQVAQAQSAFLLASKFSDQAVGFCLKYFQQIPPGEREQRPSLMFGTSLNVNRTSTPQRWLCVAAKGESTAAEAVQLSSASEKLFQGYSYHLPARVGAAARIHPASRGSNQILSSNSFPILRCTRNWTGTPQQEQNSLKAYWVSFPDGHWEGQP